MNAPVNVIESHDVHTHERQVVAGRDFGVGERIATIEGVRLAGEEPCVPCLLKALREINESYRDARPTLLDTIQPGLEQALMWNSGRVYWFEPAAGEVYGIYCPGVLGSIASESDEGQTSFHNCDYDDEHELYATRLITRGEPLVLAG